MTVVVLQTPEAKQVVATYSVVVAAETLVLDELVVATDSEVSEASGATPVEEVDSFSTVM